MYGLIGKMISVEGRRDELAEVMIAGMVSMPGCLSYVIARDPTYDDGLWITEVWENRDLHRQSLLLPAVQSTITKARPLIAGFGERFETEPIHAFGSGSIAG